MQSVLVGSKLCCALEIYVQTLLRAPDDPWPSAGATLAMHLDQALSISSCLRPSRLVREESPGLGTSPGLALRNTAPQNRVAAVLPRTVRPAPGASKRGPHPHLLPGLHIIFCLVLRGVVAKRDASLGRLRKTGFPGAGPFALRCWPSNSAVCDKIVRSDRIAFDSRPRIARANRETLELRSQFDSQSW